MNKSIFLEEFNFYKKNPLKYHHKMKNYSVTALMIFLIGYGGLSLKALTIIDDDRAAMFVGYLSIFLMIGIPTILIIYIIDRTINRKINKFNKMTFKGLTSELFPNIEHPVIHYYKNQIRADIYYKGGITGETAYEIYKGMHDKDVLYKATNPTIEQQAINEIARVHGLEELDTD